MSFDPLRERFPSGLVRVHLAATHAETELLEQVLAEAGFHPEFVPSPMGPYSSGFVRPICVPESEAAEAEAFLREYLAAPVEIDVPAAEQEGAATDDRPSEHEVADHAFPQRGAGEPRRGRESESPLDRASRAREGRTRRSHPIFRAFIAAYLAASLALMMYALARLVAG